MTRPPIERYVRLTIDRGVFTVEPGLEFREGENLGNLSHRFKQVVSSAILHAEMELPLPAGKWGMNDFPVVTAHIEEAVREYWPDRAWFVEVHGDAGWVQIFQPYGVPKNGP